eukprot:scaffold10376_cov131-Isochrysis_galbana.AAC.10
MLQVLGRAVAVATRLDDLGGCGIAARSRIRQGGRRRLGCVGAQQLGDRERLELDLEPELERPDEGWRGLSLLEHLLHLRQTRRALTNASC